MLARYADNFLSTCLPASAAEGMKAQGIELRQLNLGAIVDVFEELEEDIVNVRVKDAHNDLLVRVYVGVTPRWCCCPSGWGSASGCGCPLGLWAVSGLLLSLDGLLALVPGTWGGRLRPLSDGALRLLRELQAQPPQELVNVRLRGEEGPVQVSARTWGPLPAKKEGARPRRGMPWALCLPWELAACWLSLLLVGLLLEQSLGGLLGGRGAAVPVEAPAPAGAVGAVAAGEPPPGGAVHPRGGRPAGGLGLRLDWGVPGAVGLGAEYEPLSVDVNLSNT